MSHIESIAVFWCRTSTPDTEIGVEIGRDGTDVVIETGEPDGALFSLRMTRRKARVFAAALRAAAEEESGAEAMAELPRLMASFGITVPERPDADVRPLRAVREKEEKKHDQPE